MYAYVCILSTVKAEALSYKRLTVSLLHRSGCAGEKENLCQIEYKAGGSLHHTSYTFTATDMTARMT